MEFEFLGREFDLAAMILGGVVGVVMTILIGKWKSKPRD